MAPYHVTLDGQGLILDLAAYRKRPAQPARLSDVERPTIQPELPAGTLETSFASGEEGFSVLRAYQGRLYAGSSGSGKVYEFDGAAWSESHDHGGGVDGVSAMAEWDGTLFVANATDGRVAARKGDGVAWTYPVINLSDASGVGALVGLPGADGTMRGLLYLVANNRLNLTRAATVLSWDASAVSGELFRLAERYATAGPAFAGRVHLFGAEKDGQRYGAIYSGPAWALQRPLSDGYVLAAAALGDELYVGVSNGVVYRLAGNRLDPVGIVPGLGAMFAFAGALWSTAAVGGLVELRRFDGERWSVPFAGVAGAVAGGLAAYGDRLYLGAGGDIMRTSAAFTPLGSLKRVWHVEALVEGTAEVPLLRLDGTPEPLTGAQLSSVLWDRLAARKPVAFLDLDGNSYIVWIHGLEERVAQRSQRLGYHRLASITLVEA